MRPRTLALCTLPLAFGACRPEVGDPASLVLGPRVLAVRAEPPEAKPGDEVSYEVLVGSPDGTIADPAAYWAFCATPKPPTENNSVNSICWADSYLPIGGPAVTIQAVTPTDACRLFGPETPPGEDARPRDPDVTGGFYQPVRVAIPELAAFGFLRLFCKLGNTSADVAFEYADRYPLNKNPEIASFGADIGGAPLAFDAIPTGAEIRLTTAWTPESAEIFPVLDLAEQRLVNHRETLRVSWFVTAGELATDRTGRGETDLETFTDVTWTAPATPGRVFLWVVLRDSRGGVAFESHELNVVPQ